MALDYEENKAISRLERRFADFVNRDDEEKWKQALERIRALEAELAEARAEVERLRAGLNRIMETVNYITGDSHGDKALILEAEKILAALLEGK